MDKKSPLKDNPLRSPGESVDDEIQRVVAEDALIYIAIIAAMAGMTVYEWWRWYTDSPPSPWLITMLFVIVIAYSGWKIRDTRKRIRRLKQGRDGEKAVGQFLERLRADGAQIYHDVRGDNFNVDHVVICSAGIFVIETKSYSKPAKGEPKIRFDGETVSIDGNPPTNKPIIQVRAAVNWLRQILQESTGHDFPMKPVVLFPGWFIEPTGQGRSGELWVLHPKAFPKYLANERQKLDDGLVHMASFHLSRYIRTYEDKQSKS